MSAGLRILVVDDNADMRELLEHALALDGFVVEAVGTVRAARAAIAARRPSLVIVDILLRGESGEPVADLSRAAGIPIIVMTGDSRRFAEFAEGPDPVLAKPFRLGDLVRLVRRRIEQTDN